MIKSVAQNLGLTQTYDRIIKTAKEYFRDEIVQGDQGYLTTVAVLRVTISILVVGAALWLPHDWISLNRTLAIIGMALFCFVSVSLLYARMIKSKAFHSYKSKVFQVYFDILISVVILFVHNDPNSTWYMILALPALIAGRHFSLRWFLFTWLFILVSLFAVDTFIIDASRTNSIAFLFIILPKMLVLSVIAFFTYTYQQIKSFITEDKEEIIRKHQEIGIELQTTLDIDALIRLFCENAVKTIPGAQHSVLHIFDKECQGLVRKASHPTNTEIHEVPTFKLGQGVAGQSLAVREVINVPRVTDDERFVKKPSGHNYQSLLVAPLYIGEKLIGTISLDSCKSEAFNELSEQLLTILATQASVALANAMEFEQGRRRYDRLHKILLYSQTKLIPERGLDQLFQGVINGAREVLGYESAEVYAFGFIPRQLPGVVLDEKFDMYDLVHDDELQHKLLNFASEDSHFTYYKTGPALSAPSHSCCVPLIGVENRIIGLLILRSKHLIANNRAASQAIWLYANNAAREIEVGISLARQTDLQRILSQLEETADPAQDAITLRKGFQQLGFQRGVIQVMPLPGESEKQFSHFGVTDEVFEIIKANFSRSREWFRKHKEEIKRFEFEYTKHIGYYPWQDKWVQHEFSYDDVGIQDEQGFLLVQGMGSKHSRSVFEAALGIAKDMVEPTEAWVKELHFLIDTMAKSVENVRLTATQAIRAEREWLQDDIHTALNIIQGGPLLFSEAARNTLINAQHNGQPDAAICLAIEQLEAVEKAGHFAYKELAQLMEGLRHPTLRDKGLTKALREFGEMLALKVSLGIDIDQQHEAKLNPKTTYILYRIAQEAINNANKHAYDSNEASNQVQVSLKLSSNERWQFVIRDNGSGFPEPVEVVRYRLTSFGLRQIENWARKISGHLQVKSGQEGTEVRVIFPGESADDHGEANYAFTHSSQYNQGPGS